VHDYPVPKLTVRAEGPRALACQNRAEPANIER
jgi:hypothetical protein